MSALAETAPLAAQTVPLQRSGDTVPAAGPLAEDGDDPAQPALADTAGPEHRAALPRGAPAPGLGISGGRPLHGAERGGMQRF